ncbi:MAG: YibE/F family protein [Lentisphaeria bacterium]|nr:YibE/F family protein [Lentisphaeria bacterium]
MIQHSLKQDLIAIIILAVCSIGLFFIPPANRLAMQSGMRTRAVVTAVDNSDLQLHGLLKYGSQQLTVKVSEGKFNGETFYASNDLLAQMEVDKEFKVGDEIIVIINDNDKPMQGAVVAQDYDRSYYMWLLIGIFCAALGIFGSWTGIKALLSFIFSCVVIWKGVIPLILRGYEPIWVCFFVVCLLTLVIQFLVAGLNRKGVVAFLGAISGVLAGLCTAEIFTSLMRINGAVLPYAQAVYYSGYDFLNIQNVFVGAMILASSGAVMDLAMDISVGMYEVFYHKKDISRRELFKSGIQIGRSVVGTMTTTLLLAYSGGYITLLMLFYAQGVEPLAIMNNPLVASEAVKTLIGSFSLVLVAPLTAIIGSQIFVSTKKIRNN